jgi:hypothetical protein
MFGCHCANVPPLVVDRKTGKVIKMPQLKTK